MRTMYMHDNLEESLHDSKLWPRPLGWSPDHDRGASHGNVALPPMRPPIPAARPVELLALLGICVVADVAIYSGPGGTGMAALFATVPLILAAAAKERKVSRRFLVLSALLLLVAARSVWQSSAASVALGALLMVSFAIALRMKRTYVPELVVSALGSLFGSFQQLWNFGEGLRRTVGSKRVAHFPWRTVFIPLSLVAVFGVIFTAANPVVEGFVASLLHHASHVTWYPSPLRVFFWCGSALAAAALLRPVCRELAGAQEPTAPVADVHTMTAATADAPPASTVGLDTARNVLGALNVLFFAYNALDAVYLWAGRLPQGLGHTEYAHRGAQWLTVALLLTTVVLGVLFRGAIANDPRAKWHFRLGYAWALQNIVLAAGTFRRIQMYVDFSGLTRLRLFGIAGTLLTVVALALIVSKISRQKTMLWLVRRQLDALGLVAILFVVAPTHAWCTEFNVARVNAGEHRPLLHFFEQKTTAEGVPAMMALLDNEDPGIRRGAAALILEEVDVLRSEEADATRWTTFEGSRKRALRAFDANEARIAALLPADGRWDARDDLRKAATYSNEESEWGYGETERRDIQGEPTR